VQLKTVAPERHFDQQWAVIAAVDVVPHNSPCTGSAQHRHQHSTLVVTNHFTNVGASAFAPADRHEVVANY
jgi:hypothetical protein